MRSGLPHVDLHRDDKPGHTLVSFEINAAQQFGAVSGTLGKALRVPIRVEDGYSGRPLFLAGSLFWHSDGYGANIPGQTYTWGMTHLNVPITDEQIRSLEERRAGATLMFGLHLTGLAVVDGDAVPVSAIYPATIIVPIDDWLKILASLQFGVRRLVELPPAPKNLSGIWDEASRLIADAGRRLSAGDSGGSMSELRPALERMVEVVGAAIGREKRPSENAGPYASAIAARVRKHHRYRSDDAYEVLAAAIDLARTVFGFAADANHRGLRATDRMDAELGLGLLSALFGYLARFPLDTLNTDASDEDVEA
jgi:hypothetical protein